MWSERSGRGQEVISRYCDEAGWTRTGLKGWVQISHDSRLEITQHVLWLLGTFPAGVESSEMRVKLLGLLGILTMKLAGMKS